MMLTWGGPGTNASTCSLPPVEYQSLAVPSAGAALFHLHPAALTDPCLQQMGPVLRKACVLLANTV